MEKEKSFSIDWESLKTGTMIHMKDFPSVRLLKLDNGKACYFSFDDEYGIIVDIKTYASDLHGEYYYFKTCEDDWHPLTNRLWNV